jgi:hypothetical protein
MITSVVGAHRRAAGWAQCAGNLDSGVAHTQNVQIEPDGSAWETHVGGNPPDTSGQ